MSAYQDLFVQFKQALHRFGIAFTIGRYYSLYRAKVVSNKDEEMLGRVRVTCRAVSRTGVLDWAYPISLMGGKQRGLFFPPEVDDFVWVGFEEGDVRYPYYFGGWWGGSELPTVMQPADPKKDSPTVRGIVTPSGHQLLFDDTPDKERIVILTAKGQTLTIVDEKDKQEIKLEWVKGSDKASLSFLSDGKVELVNKAAARLTMDADGKSIILVDPNGTQITMDDKGWQAKDKDGNLVEIQGGAISLKTLKDVAVECQTADIKASKANICGSGSSAVLGEKIVQYLSTHTHPTGVGPSGPPIQPALPVDLLSRVVKLK